MRRRSAARTIVALGVAVVFAGGGYALAAAVVDGGPSRASAPQAERAIPRPLARKLETMNRLLALLRSRLRAGEIDREGVRTQLKTVVDLKDDVVAGLFAGTLYGLPLADLVRWLDKIDLCLEGALAAAKEDRLEFAADLLRCAQDWKRKVEKAVRHKASVAVDRRLDWIDELLGAQVLAIRGKKAEQADVVRRINLLRQLFWRLVQDPDLLPSAGKAYGVPRSQLFRFLHLIDIDLEAARDANESADREPAAVERLLGRAQTRKENLERLLPAPGPPPPPPTTPSPPAFEISIEAMYDHDADPQSDVCLWISTKPPRPGAAVSVKLRGPGSGSVVPPTERTGTLDVSGKAHVRFLVNEIANYAVEVTIKAPDGTTRSTSATLSNASPKGVCAPG